MDFGPTPEIATPTAIAAPPWWLNPTFGMLSRERRHHDDWQQKRTEGRHPRRPGRSTTQGT
jgi:hypothetical protein